MRLRKYIPAYPDEFLDWPRFLYKASIGSYKAEEMLTQVYLAAAGIHAGAKASEGESKAIPAHFPFGDAQGFLDALFASDYISAPIVAREKPFDDHSQYAPLWKRKKSVSVFHLVHDAVLHCANHWTPGEAKRLCDAVDADGADYNAQDAVAAMLFLIVSLGE